MLIAATGYFAVRAVTGVFSVALLAATASMLTAEEYGRYSLIVSTATIVSTLTFHWIIAAISRMYSAADGQGGIAISTLKLAIIAGGIAAMAIAFALGVTNTVGGLTLELSGVVALLAMSLGICSVASQMANATSRVSIFAAIAWTRYPVTLALIYFLAHWGLGAVDAVISLSVGTVLAAAVGVTALLRRNAKGADSRVTMNAMWAYGAPLTVGAMCVLVVDLLDRFMIAHFHGLESAGSYSIAYDLSQQTAGPLLNVLFLAAYPAIVNAHRDAGRERRRLLARRLGLALAFIGVLLSLGVRAAQEILLSFDSISDLVVRTERYLPIIVMAITIGAFKSYFLDIPLLLEGRTVAHASITLAMASINVALNFALVPEWAERGAAVSTLLTFVSGGAMSAAVGAASSEYRSDVFQFMSFVALLSVFAIAAWLISSAVCAVFTSFLPGVLAVALFIMGAGLPTWMKYKRSALLRR